MAIKIDTSDVDKIFTQLSAMPKTVMKKTYPVLKQNTPIRSGNARSKTREHNANPKRLQIKSEYPYAGRLDEGWSKQAPKGFTEPSINKLEDFVEQEIRKIR
jgi:hypothetical protein